MGETFWERKGGYGLVLDEYNGNLSIIASKRKEDKIYKDWVYISEWDENTRGFVAGNKKRPMGIYLGDREGAIKALRFFLKELGATDPGDPAPGAPEESIPF